MRAEDESSSNLRALEGKRQCFGVFYDVNMSTKAKLTVNFRAFPSMKFRKLIRQIGRPLLVDILLSRSSFFRPGFSQR